MQIVGNNGVCKFAIEKYIKKTYVFIVGNNGVCKFAIEKLERFATWLK